MLTTKKGPGTPRTLNPPRWNTAASQAVVKMNTFKMLLGVAYTQSGKINNRTGTVKAMFKTLAWKRTAPLEPGYLRHCWALFFLTSNCNLNFKKKKAQ